MPNATPAVLFDLDGTLLDSIELIIRGMRYAFEAFGRTPPHDDVLLGGIGTPLWEMLAPYCADRTEVDQYIAKYREYQYANHDALVSAYPGAVETVTALAERGHPLAIVTSKMTPITKRGLVHTGLDQFFPVLICADVCTNHKPHPEPVERALAELGMRPEDALFVGDSVHDMAAGNAAGVRTVAALWGPFDRVTLAAAHPSHYLESILELLPLVESLR